MLTVEQEKTYTRDELGLFNLIDQPVWVFDIVKKAMWFANTAAVELWSASSMQDLLQRNFSDDMSESTAQRLDDYLEKFRQGERLNDQCKCVGNPCQKAMLVCRSFTHLSVMINLEKQRDLLSKRQGTQNSGDNSLWYPH